VAECAVIGVADSLKGQLPLGFVMLKAGVSRSQENVVNEVVQLVRDRIGAVAALKQVMVVNRLPKTRSGKILRRVMRKIAEGEEYAIPASIDDPASLEDIEAAARTLGYGKAQKDRRRN
jgi:propionyl-CoA synthetase